MMRYIAFIFIIVLSVGEIAAAAQPPASFADIVEKAIPAVVNISTTQKIDMRNKSFSLNDLPENPQDLFEFFEPDPNSRKTRKIRSLGSGFIIDPQGYIVTNYHNIADADEIEVMLGDESPERYKAKVLGKDPKTDLALLKINTKDPLPFVKFGNSNESKVGDYVIAIGNPFGLGGTVTAGIISAKARYLNGSQYDDLIQTDASINRGNSGGPMFNMKGEVIGVNTLILSTTGGNIGIGFAMPSAIVEPIIDQLRNKGEISRGWLGVLIQPVDEYVAKSMGLQKIKGALVAEVVKDSPADKAGVRVGDIISRFDGKEVKNIHKLPRMVSETPINKHVSIQVFRNGKYEVLNTIIEKPTSDPLGEEAEDSEAKQGNTEKIGQVMLGIRVADLNNALRNKFKIEPALSGIIVLGINRNSPAIESGISAGDLIQQVGNKKITTIKDFENEINNIKSLGHKKAMILINKGNGTRFILIDLE
ncbi:Peptidase S1C, Do [endosymbiont of Acanthamoeba sp. UWC8]|uniref:Do family serine endopeptidase n=1 Tax=endosymbiont of Acanthamoeba sp. UWC8 TaxID=86106 RepID=UPI0004D1A383|nr:Do family serine endopeptidase [endosymbiont of Acanthamoeba sp. UWC8]AIF81665.1 Peptidase S1C, Do [endosymbiont of Acanthamoeba sp. UWC8]